MNVCQACYLLTIFGWDSPEHILMYAMIADRTGPIGRNEVWCFSMQNLQSHTNIHTSVSFTR